MTKATTSTPCEFCNNAGGEIVWQDGLCRVVRVADPDYPGFCRVIWSRHVREMTDLSAAERRHVMAVVCATEAALRALYRPDKINLASLGNVTPHLHWHVIPRFADDRHFPKPVWSTAQRDTAPPRPAIETVQLRDAIVEVLAEDRAGAV